MPRIRRCLPATSKTLQDAGDLGFHFDEPGFQFFHSDSLHFAAMLPNSCMGFYHTFRARRETSHGKLGFAMTGINKTPGSRRMLSVLH